MSIYLINDTPDIVYYHRLYGLAGAVVTLCDDVFARTAEAEQQEHYRAAAPDVHATIDAILVSAANIRKMIVTSPRKRRNEAEHVFRFRQRRASALAKLLAPLALTEILNTSARNSVEHFEEYLDAEIAGSLAAPARKRVFAAYNMVVSRLDMFPLRVYAAAERKYYNMNTSVDLRKLREESATILERLKETGVLGSTEEAGALIFGLTRADGGAA